MKDLDLYWNNYVHILETLKSISKLIDEQKIVTKEVLDMTEACKYLKISYSTLSKLTMYNEIKHYKPHGKKIYFKRIELDEWATQNKAETNSDFKIELDGNIREIVNKVIHD